MVLSCSKTRVGHPVWGVTRRFPIPAVGREARAKPYDFSKLEEGRGLYVFSYEITFKGPNRDKAKTSTGLRVWEHDFTVRTPVWKEDMRSDNVDTITKLGLIPVGRSVKGPRVLLFGEEPFAELKDFGEPIVRIPTTDPVMIAGGAAMHFISVFSGHDGPEFEMKYRKGQIVYGGRIEVNGVGTKVRMRISDCFSQDIGPILRRFADQLDGVEIITDLMTLPPPPPIDSTRIIDTIRPEPRREVDFDDL